MGRPVLLVENFFNTRLFPGHVLSANQEASGRDVGQVGSGRRMKAMNQWTPTSFNAAAWVKVTNDRVRAADTIAIDRGHNLAGKTVRVQVSNDDSTYSDAAAVVIPTATFPYSRLSSSPGVRTEEGAWLYRFGIYAAKYWRLYYDAMGSGLKPEIVNVHLGLAFSPAFPEVKPFSHGLFELDFEQTKSPAAWVGAGQKSKRRNKHLHLKTADRAEAAQAHYHVEGLIMDGRPYWYVPDDEQAERAWFAMASPQSAGLEIKGDWSEPQIEWDAFEQEPRLI